MNWMGSERRRYANRANNSSSILQKQKAHFARLRTAGQSQPPQGSHHTNAHTSSRRASSQRHQDNVRPSCYPPVKARGRANSRTSPFTGHTDGNSGGGVSKPSRLHSLPLSNAMDHESPASVLPVVPTTIMLDKEERLLMANRQRLLARKDWLGLAASRPVPHSFPASRYKEQFGKRRKIDNTRQHRQQQIYETSRTSLFLPALPPTDYLMAGALVNDDISVKIGTDALATQTQASLPSRILPNTSMRQQSTESDSLFEEPMLLGVDENGFEMIDGISTQAVPMADCARSPTAQNASRMFQLPSVLSEDSPDISDHSIPTGCPSSKYRSIPDTVPDPELVEEAELSGTENEDEKVWRSLMRIKAVPLSDTAAASRSSSKQFTQTTTSAWQPFEDPRHKSGVSGHVSLRERAKTGNEDEDIWRNFVVGSQSSIDYLSFAAMDRPQAGLAESADFRPPQGFSSREATESLHSDRATVGGTILGKSLRDISSHWSTFDRLGSCQATSMVGHSATEAPGDYEESDDKIDYASHTMTTGNVCTASAMPRFSRHNTYR